MPLPGQFPPVQHSPGSRLSCSWSQTRAAWCLVPGEDIKTPPAAITTSPGPASQVVVDLSLGVSLMAPRWSTRLFISFPILFSRPELTITQWARRQRWLGTLLSSLRAIPPVHVFEPIALSGTALLGLASHFTCNCIQCIHKKLLIQELKNIIDYYKSKRRIWLFFWSLMVQGCKFSSIETFLP